MDATTLNSLRDLVMQNPEVFIGPILPPIIDLLNKDLPQGAETKRFIATFCICLMVAAFINLNQVMLNSWDQLVNSFMVIFVESQTVYRLYFKNSYLRSKLLERIYNPEANIEDTNPPVLEAPVG